MSNDHDGWLKNENLTDLAFPITCETEDLDGNWILVSLTKWLGYDKWLAYDEDGETLVVHSSHLLNVQSGTKGEEGDNAVGTHAFGPARLAVPFHFRFTSRKPVVLINVPTTIDLILLTNKGDDYEVADELRN